MADAAETSTDIYDNPDNLKEGEVREENNSTADAEVKSEETKTEAVAEEVTAEEPKAEEKVVPESYEYSQEEGALLTEDDLKDLSKYALDNKMSQEEAHAYMEQQEAMLKAHSDRSAKSLEAEKDKWESQVEADEEIGGEDFDKNIELSRRVFKKFGSEELFNILNDTRLGSNPEIVRLGVRLGKAMSEDALLTGDNALKREKSMDI